MLEGLKAETGYEWVAKACMDIQRARMPQNQKMYALAKLSLEFLDDYGWKTEPTRPYELLRFESLKNEEIGRMSKADYEAMRQRYEHEKKRWIGEVSSIAAENESNLIWLRQVKSTFEEFKHSDVHRVQVLITEHEARRKGF